MALAHAGMTAEGDNRVLMQKIVKDLMSNVQSDKTPIPHSSLQKDQFVAASNIFNVDHLHELLKFREGDMLRKLVASQKQFAKAGKSSYDIWFKEVSDEI